MSLLIHIKIKSGNLNYVDQLRVFINSQLSSIL
jgi:hypothetical protein